MNGDESGIGHKLVNENEGQGILSDLKESKAVQHLTANARTTISEVKGKGISTTAEEVTVNVLGKGESMLEEFKATRKGQQFLAEGLKSFRKNVAKKDALEKILVESNSKKSLAYYTKKKKY